MNTLRLAAACWVLTYSLRAFAGDCAESTLTPDASKRVSGVVEPVRLARGAPDNVDVNLAAAGAVYSLLADQSPAADEALAALSGYAIADAPDIRCELLRRGERMLPSLTKFEQCPPQLRLETSPMHTRADYIALVKQGKRCE